MDKEEGIYKKVERDEYVELILKLHNEMKEEFKKEIDKIKTELAEFKEDTTYQRGLDRERLKIFDDYIDLKGKERRDYDDLSIKLKNEIVRRRRKGMDYRDIGIFFGFKSPTEAYRVIKRTKENFPEDVIIREIRNSKRRKKIICPR